MQASIPLKPQNVFLVFSLFFGIVFVFIMPPFMIKDETAHFYRIYEIVTGKIISTKYKITNPQTNKQELIVGNYYPQEIQILVNDFAKKRFNGFVKSNFREFKKFSFKEILNHLNIHLNKNSPKPFLRLFGASSYSPIPYIPQIIGVFLAKLLNFPVLSFLYIARILNLITWIILIYNSIKITPIKKWLFCLLSLTPLCLFQASSLSADGMTTGLSFLYIALILKYTLDETKQYLSIKNKLFLLLIAILLSLSKSIYFALIPLVLLIPAHKFNSLKTKLEKYYFSASIIIISLILAYSWNYLVKDLGYFVEPRILNTKSQIDYIIAHPIGFLNLLCFSILSNFYLLFFNKLIQFDSRMFITHLPNILISMNLLNLLYFSILSEFYVYFFCNLIQFNTRMFFHLPKILIFMNLLLIYFVALIDIQEKQIKRLQKVFMGIISAGTIVLIFFVMFVYCTFPDSLAIKGVQGRYFIPISPLLYLLLQNNLISMTKENFDKYIPNIIIHFVSIILIVSCASIIAGYY